MLLWDVADRCWVLKLWSATCSRNPFSNMLLENTGNLLLLQRGNVALRCFINLGDKENGDLEESCLHLGLVRGAELTIPVPVSEGAWAESWLENLSLRPN